MVILNFGSLCRVTSYQFCMSHPVESISSCPTPPDQRFQLSVSGGNLSKPSRICWDSPQILNIWTQELEIVASPQLIWVSVLLFCSCQVVNWQLALRCLAVFGHSSSKKKSQKLTSTFFLFLRWMINLEPRAQFWKRKEH